MKLVLAIIHDEDASRLTTALNQHGFQVTKLATTGGFLRIGNTTMLIGVEEDHLDEVMNIIHDRCKTKKQMTVANQSGATMPEGFVPYPIEVTSGGAVVFVLDVEQFKKF